MCPGLRDLIRQCEQVAPVMWRHAAESPAPGGNGRTVRA
ncbi:hypothetical protein RC1_2450 [Rhodospirillum centenum SW]|uniref:Uncharacterized protein n=1 Tax=Rhodospirillum centenum (strain ATCC 51521 / SW) TaxID=414684 RepID=B6IUK8_RHOCS|nr:hypothetical protein RC1_2450 [Rhodospirillum centenum SW]